MAAKSKKRLSKIENKLLKLDKLELNDVFCSICHSILIEPVTLPCFHDFCQLCFNGSIENNALSCPLCRLRIGSWLRTATKQKNLVNIELWNFIKSKFSREIDLKTKGEDDIIPQVTSLPRLSAPGEIRSEYEAELKRLRAERLRLEQKHFDETELLISKIQQEEEEAHKKYLEALKQDEILALQMHKAESSAPQNMNKKINISGASIKPCLKATKIDGFFSKMQTSEFKNSPLLTDDNTTSTDSSTPKISISKPNNHGSPEMVPTYGKLIKSVINKKVKNGPGFWNKENGESLKEKKEPPLNGFKVIDKTEEKHVKSKPAVQSLLVSLPLSCTGILKHKPNIESKETDSVDSMHQELCFFKPIEETTPTSFHTNKGLPLRVPGVRPDKEPSFPCEEGPPNRAQYLDSLCRLRSLSLAHNLPSAFVIALNMLRVTKEQPAKCTKTRSRTKKNVSNQCGVLTLPIRKNAPNKQKQSVVVDGITKLNTDTNLRRTRSMVSITKEDNETTPKKVKHDRKACSDRKPYLRSDSKRSNTKKDLSSPTLVPETLNNNKVNLAVKNLSSPLKNCDVKKILQEQLRIEKIIEQEQSDYELARKMEAEWNGRRLPRRAALKRPVALGHALRPAKKLKV